MFINENKAFHQCQSISCHRSAKNCSFFGLPLPGAGERSIILEGQKLSEIYKYDTGQKKVHIFSFGCIVFEDMEIDETDRFYESLQQTAGEPDYRMLLMYRKATIQL